VTSARDVSALFDEAVFGGIPGSRDQDQLIIYYIVILIVLLLLGDRMQSLGEANGQSEATKFDPNRRDSA
jgi:hypothetical protein